MKGVQMVTNVNCFGVIVPASGRLLNLGCITAHHSFWRHGTFVSTSHAWLAQRAWKAGRPSTSSLTWFPSSFPLVCHHFFLLACSFTKHVLAQLDLLRH